jgi:FkbM family methyltransferase
LTPGLVRKSVRMAENYVNRLRAWAQLRHELVAGNPRSRAVLRRSLALAPLTSLVRLDSYQGPRFFEDVEVEVAGVGRFAVRAGTDDILHVMTSREPHVRRVIEQRLSRGGTFVDAGANIGFYSVLAARLVGPEGRVFAFEMMPDTAEILRRHVRLNTVGWVQVVEQALAERNGETVTASVEPGKHGQASIVSPAGGNGRITAQVATVTLDTALAEVGRIDVLKMDLEGAEYLALLGAGQVLARTGCVVFESNDEDPRVFGLFRQHGFAVERLIAHDFIAVAAQQQ